MKSKRWFKVWSAITGIALTVALVLTFLPMQVSIDMDGILSISLRQASANPDWLSGWSYRKSHNLTGATGAGTDYQIKVEIHAGDGTDDDPGDTAYLGDECTDFPNDITFTDNDGITELSHWLECQELASLDIQSYWSYASGFIGYQGIAVDSDFVYLMDSTNDAQEAGHCTVRKYTKAGTLNQTQADYHTLSSYLTSSWHGFSDGNIIDNMLYVTAMENSTPSGDSLILIIDPSDLSVDSEQLLTDKAGIEGIDKYDGYFWTVYWESDVIRQYYSSNWTFVAEHNIVPSNTVGKGYQTIVWDGDDALCKQHGTNVDRQHWTGSGFEFIEVIMPDFWAEYPGKSFAPLAKGVDDGEDIFWHPSFDENKVFKCQLESSYAAFWVKVNDSLESGTVPIYIYYGKNGQASSSNGTNTFIVFDDFERGSDGDPIGGDWTIAYGDIDISIGQDIGDVTGFTGTRSMKLVGTATYPQVTIVKAAGTDYAIRFRVYKENLADWRCMHGDGSEQLYFVTWPDETVRYYNGAYVATGSSVTADDWELFEIDDINHSTPKYDIWLNGVKIQDDADMHASADNNGLVRFIGENTAGYDTWIDDFIVRKFTSPEPTHGGWGSEETLSAEITNTPDSNNFGVLEVNTTGNTTINYFTIENTGNCNVDVTIQGTDVTNTSRQEYYNTGETGTAYAYNTSWMAQTFTPSASHTITSVNLKLLRIGSPGTVTVSIRATDGEGKPTGGDLCSGTTDGDTLGLGSLGWREVTLGSGYTLNSSTKYAIVVRVLNGDSSNKVGWGADYSTASYSGGSYGSSTDSGSSWTLNTGIDFMFEDWGYISWDLDDTGTPGENIYGLYAGLDDDDDTFDVIVKETETYNTLLADLAEDATQDWGLKIYMPTSVSGYDAQQMSGTITLVASAS